MSFRCELEEELECITIPSIEKKSSVQEKCQTVVDTVCQEIPRNVTRRVCQSNFSSPKADPKQVIYYFIFLIF